jgi:hypothetical protein
MMPSGPPESTARSKSTAHQHLGAYASRQHVSLGHLAVVEVERKALEPRMPSLSSLVPAEKPLKPFSTMKAVMPGAHLGFGLGVDHQRVGVATVGDPHLAAVEHIAVALLLGPQLHADHVGAGIGLAHRQRPHARR